MKSDIIHATIALDRLPVTCIVGILGHERTTEQEIFLDIRLVLDATDAIAGEDIDATVDYAALADDLTEFVKAEKFLLIETMAARCGQRILANHARVESVDVTVNKPQAVPRAAGTRVQVKLARTESSAQA
ncbi:MAG: dihydroneopterin aldolase [Fibrobacterota bacterium]|jgi:dihydroneopterin aldolase